MTRMKKRDFVTSIWFPVVTVVGFALFVAVAVHSIDFERLGQGLGKFGAAVSEGYNEGRD